MHSLPIEIRELTDQDKAQWRSLYAGYRTFYKLEPDPAAIERTWGWLIGREHGLVGTVAVDPAGALLGLAHLRFFARPSSGGIGLYLDDLFTTPESRGQGIATALLHHAADMARDRDANVVRWITAADNATARRVYDANAIATPWVTYDMRPAQ